MKSSELARLPDNLPPNILCIKNRYVTEHTHEADAMTEATFLCIRGAKSVLFCFATSLLARCNING
jgi:hypothetical protein